MVFTATSCTPLVDLRRTWSGLFAHFPAPGIWVSGPQVAGPGVAVPTPESPGCPVWASGVFEIAQI